MKILQTPFIDYNDRNRVFLDLEEGERWKSARLSLPGWSEKLTIGKCFGEVRVPLVQSETCIYVELWDDDNNYSRTMAILKPVKRWKVGFLHSSHEDLGYEEYVTRLAAGCCELTELALDYMDAFPDYHYFIEHMDWLRTVTTYRGKEITDRIKKHFHSGQLDICTPHSGVHTHWHGAEQMARSTIYARECAEKYEVDPKTALFADISGVSWSAVGAYAQAGVRYLINTHNRFRDHKNGYPIPPLFWWQAPNGHDRLLFWTEEHYQDEHFSVSGILCPSNEFCVGVPHGKFMYSSEDAEDIPFSSIGAPSPREKLAECNRRLDESDLHPLELSISKYLNSLASYSWDVLPVSFYMDRQFPSLMPKAFCDRMSSKWKWPVFTMRTPTDCMKELEDRFGEVIPTMTGDLSNQWSDAMTASPTGVACKRRTERWLPAVETLNALLGKNNASTRDMIYDAYYRMCSFDDHCWATGIKYPTDLHRFNHQYVKEQSARVAEKAMRGTLNCLVRRDDAGSVSVFWPQPEEARVPVRIPEAIARGRTLEGTTGQRLFDGSILTSPVDFGAFSARRFALSPLADGQKCFAQVTDSRITTARYDLHFDHKTGQILSLIDLTNSRDMIDPDSKDKLGEFLFIETVDKEHPEYVMNKTATLSVEILNGPLAVTLLRKEFEPESRAKITTAVTLYRDMPQIDIESRFEDATAALLGGQYDRYRKNIFYAFPLNIHEFRFLTEMTLGWIDERTERLPLRAQDFVIAKDALRVEEEDGRYGILLTSRDMPVFHLGSIHYQQFNQYMPLPTSHVYVYAASNRCCQLTADTPEECRGEYQFSLLPYTAGERDCLCAKVDCLMLRPLVLEGVLESESLLNLEAPPSVRLCALFPTGEDSRWLLRVRECAGYAGRATLQLPFEIRSARYAGIAGDETDRCACVEGSTVEFVCEPHAYTTLLMEPTVQTKIPPVTGSESKVKNVFWYVGHDGKIVVCWEKAKPFAEGCYVICCNEKPIKEVAADPYSAQIVTVDAPSGGQFTVEYKTGSEV